MKQTQKLPPIIGEAVNDLAKKYSESPHTTNAGRILRIFARVVPLDTLLKIINHKASF